MQKLFDQLKAYANDLFTAGSYLNSAWGHHCLQQAAEIRLAINVLNQFDDASLKLMYDLFLKDKDVNDNVVLSNDIIYIADCLKHITVNNVKTIFDVEFIIKYNAKDICYTLVLA